MNNVIGVGNTLFYPIFFVLYKLLVVLPNQLIYHVLQLINYLTGANLITMLTKDNNGQSTINGALSPQNQFFSIFLYVILIGLIVFVIAFIFGLLRAYFKKSSNGEVNHKANVVDILKRSIGGIVIVILIPIMFVAITSFVGYFFSLLFNVGSFRTASFTDQNNAYVAISEYITKHWNEVPESIRSSWKGQEKMIALMTFNIWTAGYDLSGEINGNTTLATLINRDGHDLNNVMKNIFNLMKGDSFWDGNTAATIANIGRWNIFISVLCSLVMLYLIIMFVVSVLSRLLEIYFLVLISPIVIFGGIAIDKSQGKWIVKTFHKIITVNVAILGYFFFNLIYLLLLSSVLGNIGSITLTLLKFGLLFAGMVLVNQIPKLFMAFLNSDEQVLGNELKEASSQTKLITAPLTTAMGSAFTGTLAFMRGSNNNLSHSYQPITSNNNNANYRY